MDVATSSDDPDFSVLPNPLVSSTFSSHLSP